MGKLNWLHNSLLEGSQLSMTKHLVNFGAPGALIGAGVSFVNGQSMVDGAFNGGLTGMGIGAGFKYAANIYTKGAINLINSSTDNAGNVLYGTIRNTQHQGNFRMANFTQPNAMNLDFSLWHGNKEVIKNARFQHYNAAFDTSQTNPQYIGSKWGKLSEFREQYY